MEVIVMFMINLMIKKGLLGKRRTLAVEEMDVRTTMEKGRGLMERWERGKKVPQLRVQSQEEAGAEAEMTMGENYGEAVSRVKGQGGRVPLHQ